MRFVDGDQIHVPALQIRQKAGKHQTLRRDIEQLVFSIAQTPQRPHLHSCLSEEFRNVAAMPLACSASTWSFISEINGETTTVNPGRASAGN